MNQLIDEIYTKLRDKHGISKTDIDRIVDSQFRVLEDNIRNRGNKTVNLIYIGKFKPSKSFLKNYDKLKDKFITKEQREASSKIQRDKFRMEKSNNGQKENNGRTEDVNLQQMSS